MKGQQVKYAVHFSVKTVHVYCSFQNDTITVTVSNKCCGSFEYVFIMNLK